MNSETFVQNKKKKELCFADTLSDKFLQIVLKFATFYLSCPFFLAFLYKIPF